MRYVLVHPVDGIFAGTSGSYSAWTMVDGYRQSRVPTFGSLEEVSSMVARLTENDGRFYSALVETRDTYVGCGPLRAAGLGDLLGDLQAMGLRGHG